MRLRTLLLLLSLTACALPLQAQQKKKPVETPKPAARPAAPKPAPAKEPEAFSYLLISTDLDVNVNVNYVQSYRILSSDEGKRLPLEEGENLIKITPLDGGSDGYSETINLEKKGNRIMEIKLNAKRIAEAARVAEEKQRAEEQRLEEQRRKEEEAQRIEEARKAEEKRKQEEAKKEEEARLAEEKRKLKKGYQIDSLVKEINAGMVIITGGSFEMGNKNGNQNEKPVHRVTLNDFYLSAMEITQAQWRTIMGTNPSSFSDCDQCPVENVSWDEVQKFISELNRHTGALQYRLPTEAEWEYAARGGNLSRGYKYAGSNNLDEVAWHQQNASSKTHPTGSKKPNELGLYDMSGNVWEWCSDWLGTYSSKNQINPTGPSTGTVKVYRGGAWSFAPSGCSVTFRYSLPPGSRNFNLGFRLARTL